MRAVDTHVLVRLIVRDDPIQTAAADRWVEGGAWVSLLALAETTWVLSAVYDRDARTVARALEVLQDHQHLTLQDADVVAAAVDQFKAKPSLGFSDCLMVHIAAKAGHGPLGTFDKAVARLDGAERVV